MRMAILYLLGIITCFFYGAKDNMSDKIESEVNRRMAVIADSLRHDTYDSTLVIKQIRKENLTLVKKVVDENNNLKEENSVLNAKLNFYRSIANDPVILHNTVKKELSLSNDYTY